MTGNQQQENCKKHKQHATKQWITEEIREEVKKYLEANENKGTTPRNLWDAAKAVLRRKFISIKA